jgi:hypothetical protein
MCCAVKPAQGSGLELYELGPLASLVNKLRRPTGCTTVSPLSVLTSPPRPPALHLQVPLQSTRAKTCWSRCLTMREGHDTGVRSKPQPTHHSSCEACPLLRAPLNRDVACARHGCGVHGPAQNTRPVGSRTAVPTRVRRVGGATPAKHPLLEARGGGAQTRQGSSTHGVL